MADAAVQPADLNQEASRAVVSGRAGALSPVFGPGAIFVFAACAIGLPYSGLLPFSTVAEAWPGADLVIILAVALVVSIIHAYTFAAIGVVGRDGQAGALVSGRGLKKPLAFASSWTLAIFLSLSSGVIIGWVFREILPMFARGLSILFDNQVILNRVTAISTQDGMVLYGSFGVLLIFLLLFIPPHITSRVMLGGLALAAAAWVIVCVQLASGTPQSFFAAWDALMGSGSFLDLLEGAESVGLQFDHSLQNTLTAGLAMGLVVLSGYFFPSYFASEARAPQKHLFRSSLLALTSCGVLLLAGTFLAQRIIPLEFLSAQAALGQIAQFQGTTLPWLPFYAALLQPDQTLFWAVGVGWVAGLTCLALALAYTASRIVQGWADGGFLPEGVRFVHPELRSPLIAVLLVSMVVEVGLVAYAMGIDARLWLPLALAGAQIVPVATLIWLPFRQKALYEQSAALVTRKIGPLPLITIAGLFSLAHLIATVVFLLITPALRETTRIGGLAFAAVFVMGIVWYYGSQPYHGQSAAGPG